MVRHVHNLKTERLKYKIVTVCGTRDAGKTTLVSLLLHDPKIALQAGIAGDRQETCQVKPYRVHGMEHFALLDTPGLTTPDDEIRGKFAKGALRLSAGFVYIRNYHGLAEDIDVQTLASILSNASRLTKVPVLICLNNAEKILTRDAVGERFDLKAREQKVKWKDHLVDRATRLAVNILSGPNCQVEFVDLSGDRRLEQALQRNESLSGTWTAHSIGQWIADQVETSETMPALTRHLDSFDYKVWQQGVLEQREREAMIGTRFNI